jgi:hypothetical protein
MRNQGEKLLTVRHVRAVLILQFTNSVLTYCLHSETGQVLGSGSACLIANLNVKKQYPVEFFRRDGKILKRYRRGCVTTQCVCPTADASNRRATGVASQTQPVAMTTQRLLS